MRAENSASDAGKAFLDNDTEDATAENSAPAPLDALAALAANDAVLKADATKRKRADKEAKREECRHAADCEKGHVGAWRLAAMAKGECGGIEIRNPANCADAIETRLKYEVDFAFG